MIHGNKRVSSLCQRATAGLDRVAYLEAQIKGDDIRERLKLARHSFEDIDSFFIRRLDDGFVPPEKEAMWLNSAEMALRVAHDHLGIIEDIIKTFGPNAIFG